MQTRLRWSVWWGLSETVLGGNLKSDGRFYVVVSGKNLDSAAVKMFSRLTCFKKEIYKCTFNAIRKYNIAINYIIVKQEKVRSRQRLRVTLRYFLK
jgi:hypothetical protein